MRRKLLVIAVGTTSAAVGQAILKQVEAHPSNLELMVRYIDTAYLPNRYPAIRQGEWFQMSIQQRYIEAIYKRIDDFPRLKSMLFPGLLPGTDGSGGGSIRYNGAGAVEIQRDNLKRWLSESMAELAMGGTDETSISMVLIVSAVGATGSGSLERLLEVIVDAAHQAHIRTSPLSTIHCDTYILQPGKVGVTELGLANTLALYAELAASAFDPGRLYYGRKILVGWDSIPVALSSLQDLVEATATLIRLSNDPISSLPAEFGEREVDHHVLASLDHITNLPAHLSTATAITISLGDLVERAVERDVARLIEGLVFSESATGPSNILFGKLVTAMAGESARARYKKLLDYLSETTGVARMRTALDAVVVEKGVSAEKASRLQRIYQRCMLEIQQGKSSIENQARRFLDSAIRDLEDSKHELFNKGFSLAEIRGGFLDVEHLVNDMLEEALKDAGESVVNERAVEEQLQGINASSFRTLFGGRERLVNLVGQMQRNLQGRLQESARDAAFIVLDRLQNYCAQVGRNLDIVLNKLHKQKENKEGWAAAYRENTLDTGHPLHLIALSTPKEMKSYSEKVSVFTAQPGMRASALSETEQLAEFRKWQEGKIEFAVLFEGDVGNLADVATRYVEEKVRMEVGKYLLIDVLLQMDEEVLFRLLGEAMSRAASLVSYESALSSDRYECWLVIADYGNDERRRKKLVEALGKAFPWRTVQLLQSDDPTEIAIFYYVDGLPMSAIDDLRGRCLNAFLAYRQRWNQQQISLNSSSPAPSIGALNQRISVPVYSGKDAETRVLEKGIIHRLYAVKNAEVGGYSQVDVPELRDNEWEALQQVLHQTLIRHGIVSSSSFSHLSAKDAELLFKRYIQEHPNVDLEYQESNHSLRLSSRVAATVESVYSLLEPLVLGAQNGTLGKSHEEFEAQLEEFLWVFSSSTGINIIREHLSKDFATFFIDTETMFDNIRVPNPVLALISPHCEISLGTVEYLRRLLINKKNSAETQIVILILFCRAPDLDVARRLLKTFSATYGRDIVLLNHEDLMEVVAAKESVQALRRLVLSQVSLAAVHPFVTEGPTPPHFFFGREPQLREISDRVAAKSYVLIGGRRIGKTSILNRLLRIQLSERFLPFLFSCQSIDKQEPGKADFLAASSRNWQNWMSEAPSGHLSSFTDIVRVLPGDKPLVFLIDEADRLVRADSLAGWPLFGELRALAEEGRCQFVLAGEYGLSEAMNNPGSPFHNFATRLSIGRLDRLAVNELVTHPLAQLGIELINQEAIVGRIYESTSGHPNIVQRLCQRLINLLDQSQCRQITVEDVENIIALREFQQDDFLNTYWERATTLERIISLLIAQNSERLYTLHDIRQMLSDCLNLTPQALEVDKALRRLAELRNILALTPHGYTLAVEAFPLVVTNTITVADSLEVLVEIYLESGDSVL